MTSRAIALQILGALSRQQQLLVQVVQDLPATDLNRCIHDRMPSIGWLLGPAVYLELYWLRERLSSDADLSGRAAAVRPRPAA